MTLEDARRNLTIWRTAQHNIAVLGQSYRIADRQFTAANLSEINKMIAYWQSVVDRLEGRRRRGVRMQTIVPVDL